MPSADALRRTLLLANAFKEGDLPLGGTRDHAIRADARRESRIVASIGPNTRVQLGETRDGWIRVRTSGLSGWVERRSFFGGPTPRRSRTLGAR